MNQDISIQERAVVGDRLPADPTPRRRAVHRFGPGRALHLGDLLGPVRALRALAADPGIDLVVRIAGAGEEGAADQPARVAAALVACGLGSVSFEADDDTVLDLTDGAHRPDAVRLPPPPPVHDLREPRVPMGSVRRDGRSDPRGVVHLLDSPLRVAAVIRGAQTDLDPTLGYDPQLRPGVANLAVILGLLTDRTPIAALFGLHGAHQLKRAVTDVLTETLRPIRGVYADLAADPVTLSRLVRPAS